MAKFCGYIGFETPKELRPGVWSSDIVEHKYYGDITRNNRKWENGTDVNDDLNISNVFSVLADSFCKKNLGCMKYLVYMGTKWKIKSVDIQLPRLNITVGGVYHDGPVYKTEDAEKA